MLFATMLLLPLLVTVVGAVRIDVDNAASGHADQIGIRWKWKPADSRSKLAFQRKSAWVWMEAVRCTRE